ncbi:MAG: hypothetical protein BEN18_03745 [Epulopiscium sp. Nuni2H_MBin001]|nr:MAG: hypothetical protein BEN18_03745 [Epulopiscium sp. Nuni2H_MBin001]
MDNIKKIVATHNIKKLCAATIMLTLSEIIGLIPYVLLTKIVMTLLNSTFDWQTASTLTICICATLIIKSIMYGTGLKLSIHSKTHENTPALIYLVTQGLPYLVFVTLTIFVIGITNWRVGITILAMFPLTVLPMVYANQKDIDGRKVKKILLPLLNSTIIFALALGVKLYLYQGISMRSVTLIMILALSLSKPLYHLIDLLPQLFTIFSSNASSPSCELTKPKTQNIFLQLVEAIAVLIPLIVLLWFFKLYVYSDITIQTPVIVFTILVFGVIIHMAVIEHANIRMRTAVISVITLMLDWKITILYLLTIFLIKSYIYLYKLTDYAKAMGIMIITSLGSSLILYYILYTYHTCRFIRYNVVTFTIASLFIFNYTTNKE